MNARLDYENCVRSFYNLSAPRIFSVMPEDMQKGSPGCWSGPVAYDAPGYLEGAAVSAAAFVDLAYSLEVIYDFATMEKQHFDVIQLGASTQVGASLIEYQGIVFNFNNVENIENRYRGPFLYGSGGAGTGFPGVAQLNTGATYFRSITNDVQGLSQYYSFSIGFGGLPALLGQFSVEGGLGVATPMEKFSPSSRVTILAPAGECQQ